LASAEPSCFSWLILSPAAFSAPGDVALGLLLVALLGGLGGLALDRLGDVVGGVLNRVDSLADDAVVGVVGVRGRHCDVRLGWLCGEEK
jgi:hypothetical protein